MKLQVATCQFPVSADIRQNSSYITRQMHRAKEQGAQVAHFGECALSGYAGIDFPNHAKVDWKLLRECSEEIAALAGKLRLWTILGSAHPLTGKRKPHNSAYVINDRGKLIDRYDKRFCAGDASGKTSELAHYSPGDHSCTFKIGSLRCGILICHEYRYPELYREYERHGVDLVFHSYNAGSALAKRMASMQAQVGKKLHRLNPGKTLPEITMPASMHAAAAANHVWISCANNSARVSCFASFFLRADGVITGRLRRHVAGVLISTLDTGLNLYDSTGPWRERAIRGQLHSGSVLRDPRSRERESF